MRFIHTSMLTRVVGGVLIAVGLCACQTQKNLAKQEAKLQAERLNLSPPLYAESVSGDSARRVHYASQTPIAPRKAAVDFYVGMTEPLPGLIEVQGPHGPLWLYPQVILQRDDLSRISTLQNAERGDYVQFALNEWGTRKWAEVSSQNVGGLIVMVMDDQVVDVARISAPMTRGVIYFPMDSSAAAKALFMRIK